MTKSAQKGKNEYRIRKIMGLMLCSCMVFMCACATADTAEKLQQEDAPAQISVNIGPESYDSADTPILIEKNEEKKTMTFFNIDVGKKYTLDYDGTTCFYDKYGKPLTLSQIMIGDIVDVRFLKPKKHLVSVQLSENSWSIKDTERYSLNPGKHEIIIGEDIYKISSDAVYFSEGKRVEERDIIDTDTLSFQGIGNIVYSVSVEKGHGYLRLTGHQGFEGGWIEIGNSVISKVTEEMLITVPEGKYQVKISNEGTTAEKTVVINRNSESTVDFADVEFATPKTGMVLFSITPTKAKLFIDGEEADVSEGVELTYGLHQLICKADGYKTITQYLNVGQQAAGIDITLEKSDGEEQKEEESTEKKEESTDSDKKTEGEGTEENKENKDTSENKENEGQSDNSDSDKTDNSETQNNTTEGSETDNNNNNDNNNSDNNDNNENTENTDPGTITDVTTTYYKVYIDSPADTEIYLDGAYVGVCPCSFKKTEGLHVVTLSRDGYITRSYTIQVDGEDSDISFSFAELVKTP